MKIQVTQEHIDKGVRGSCRTCPVALALSDAGIDAYISYYYIKSFTDLTIHVETPIVVKEFIAGFDSESPNRKPVEPFEFEIEL